MKSSDLSVIPRALRTGITRTGSWKRRIRRWCLIPPVGAMILVLILITLYIASATADWPGSPGPLPEYGQCDHCLVYGTVTIRYRVENGELIYESALCHSCAEN